MVQEKNIKRLASVGMILGVVGMSSMIVKATSDSNRYATVKEIQNMLNTQTLGENQKLQVYPVGSIYMSANGSNPGSYLGGTWIAWGSGRVPVGVTTNDGNFNTVEKTGGESTHAVTAGEMPSHTHTFTGSAITSSGNSATPIASYQGTSVTSGYNSVTPSAVFIGSTVNTGNNSVSHTQYFPELSGKTGGGGEHSHIPTKGGLIYTTKGNSNSDWIEGMGLGDNYNDNNGGGGIRRASLGLDVSGQHEHTVTTAASSTGGNSTSHYHSVTTTGNVSFSNTTHMHSVTASGSVSLANTAHTHSMTAAGSNSNTGAGGAHNNLQPYITCYMWKRTA